ncbi:TPA: sulfate permease [Candidatus Gastranaerophilales bacterium HUM_3]|nr:SulP family inorganic anion transporter [Acinetobacter sp.]DAA87320.1 MAG TPA: sulfate permease [Candidatus Gastranaerophilales bacterium HUM_3]DAB21622.1 MAG TPA: sulfate permease [Candidatus Gastranaerophilales bacterium HUM_22]
MIKSYLKIFAGDVLGSLNSAIVALPQALAFGVATGFGASAGVWGAIILCFIAGLLGSKVPLVSGITGPVTIVIASIMAALNADISSVILVIFMAGILQVILSLTSLPAIVKYVPYPVISGFMNGIGVIIIIMQINPLLGCPVMSNTITSISAFFKNLHTINYDALLIGVITLVIVFAIPKKFNKIIPSQAIALVICTLLSMKLGLNVDKISNISISFPHLTLPKADLHAVITYFHYAVTLAIVLSSESLLTVLVADSLLKTKTPSKGMLLGQGVGNMVCALTGSLPGSAATMRTVAAINTGSSTKLTAVINPLILMFLLFKLSGFVAEIPLAVLAGILIKIGYDIIDVKLLKVIKFAPRDDLYVLALVFFLTVFYNLIVAVGAGITCAALLYAKRTADSAKLVQKTVYDKDIIKLEKLLEKDYNHKIRVVHIDGQFFFGSATQLISQFDEILGTKYLILDYSSENLLDISAIFALEDIIIRLQSQKVKILVVLKSDSVKEQFEKHGIINQLGDEHIFRTEPEAIDFAKKCIKKKVKKRHFWQH